MRCHIKTTRKNVLFVSAVIAVSALIYFFVYWPKSPLGQQLQNLKIADQQAVLLNEKFKGDPVFKHIEFHKFPAFDGCLIVSGQIVAENDVRYITNLVESMKLPVKVRYEITASNESFVFQWFDGNGETADWKVLGSK